jgi:hypothetical protein
VKIIRYLSNVISYFLQFKFSLLIGRLNISSCLLIISLCPIKFLFTFFLPIILLSYLGFGENQFIGTHIESIIYVYTYLLQICHLSLTLFIGSFATQKG